MPLNLRSAGTCSGSNVVMLEIPRLLAFAWVSSTERVFTSTAQTLAFGRSLPRFRAIGPQPQPRSSRFPESGARSICSIRTSVPKSSCVGLNVPEAVVTSTNSPATGIWIVLGFRDCWVPVKSSGPQT